MKKLFEYLTHNWNHFENNISCEQGTNTRRDFYILKFFGEILIEITAFVYRHCLVLFYDVSALQLLAYVVLCFSSSVLLYAI